MLNSITITNEELINQAKLNLQIPGLIQSILIRKLIAATAGEKNITVESEELQQAADDFRSESDLLSAQKTWSWLQKHSLSLENFEQLLKDNILAAKVAHELFDQEVEAFFVEHKLDYTQVAMYEVILDDLDLATEIFYALKEEEISLAEVARQYIQEPELRRMGGYKGLLCRHDLKPAISAAVFCASPPQVLQPIMVEDKVHLIFVEEAIKPQLNEELRSEIIWDLFNDWLEDRINELEVTVQLSQVDNISNLTRTYAMQEK